MTDTSPRDELIWKMAEAAWKAHYCPTGASGELCENCKADDRTDCFELEDGFTSDTHDRWEWWNAARGALEALESAKGIKIGG